MQENEITIQEELVSPEFLYSLELLSEIKNLSNEDFEELDLRLSTFLMEEFIRRFGEQKYIKQQ